MNVHATPEAATPEAATPEPAASEPAASEPLAADGGPRIHGVVDVIRPDRVAGWAIDRADPGAHVAVRLEREGRLVAEAPADRHRKDLEKGGVGTGRYGFSLPLDPVLEPGMEFTLAVIARTRDGMEVRLRAPRAEGARPETRLLERVFAEVSAIRAALAALDARLAAAASDDRLKAAALEERLTAAASDARLTAAASDARLSAAGLETARALERVEVIQTRLEAAAAGLEAPAAPDLAGLRALAGAALAVAGLSLAIGLASLWAA